MSETSVENNATDNEISLSLRCLAVTLLCSGASVAAAMLAVGKAFNLIEEVTHIGDEYRNNPAFRDWPGWTETYMTVHPMWFGFVFAAGFIAFSLNRPIGSWSSVTCWGVGYGALLFVLGSFPVFTLIYASFRVSPELVIVSWGTRNLVQYLVAGMCVGLVVRLCVGQCSAAFCRSLRAHSSRTL